MNLTFRLNVYSKLWTPQYHETTVQTTPSRQLLSAHVCIMRSAELNYCVTGIKVMSPWSGCEVVCVDRQQCPLVPVPWHTILFLNILSSSLSFVFKNCFDLTSFKW
jgi:hypothetical protein